MNCQQRIFRVAFLVFAASASPGQSQECSTLFLGQAQPHENVSARTPGQIVRSCLAFLTEATLDFRYPDNPFDANAMRTRVSKAWETGEGAVPFDAQKSSIDVRARGESAERVRQILVLHPEIFSWIGRGELPADLLRQAGLEGSIDPVKLEKAFRSLADYIRQDDVRSLAFRFFEQKSLETRLFLLRLVPPEHFIKVAQGVQDAIQSIDMSKLDSVKAFQSTQGMIAAKNLRKSKFSEFGTRVIREYFLRIPPEMKRKMITALLRTDPQAGIVAQLSAIVREAGPLLQKIFQLVGKESDSPIIQAVAEMTFSSLKALPFEQVRPIVEARYGKIEDRFSFFEEDATGNVGSVGQSHRVVVKGETEFSFLKVLIPAKKPLAEMEIKIFRDLMEGDLVLENLLAKSIRILEKEMNFLAEAQNIVSGQRYTAPGIDVIKLKDGFEPHPEVFVMTCARGKKLYELPDTDLNSLGLKAEILTNLLGRWFDLALFDGEKPGEEAMFHGDPHPGNIFYEVLPARIEGSNLRTRSELIDFGNFDKFPLAQRQQFTQLIMGIFSGSADRVFETLLKFEWMGGNKPSADALEQMKQEIQSILSNSELKTGRKIGDIFTVAIETGLDVPEQILSMERGRAFLETQLKQVIEKMEALDPTAAAEISPPWEIYSKVIAKRASLTFLFGNGYGGGTITQSTLSEAAVVFGGSLGQKVINLPGEGLSALRKWLGL